MRLHWYNNDFAHRQSLTGHKLLPDTFPVAVTFPHCVKRTPLPILAILFSVRSNRTCHELSSAEIAVCTHMHTPKRSYFSDLHSSLQRILWSMHITSPSPLLLLQPAFIYYYTVFQTSAEACQGTTDMSIHIIHLRQKCESLFFRYILCLLIYVLLLS